MSNPPPFRCCIWPPWEAGSDGLTLTLTSYYYAPNVISLGTGLCIVLRPEFYWRLGWIVLTVLNSFSQTGNQEHHVNICYCGNISFGHGWRRTIVSYDVPAARLPKKCKAALRYHKQYSTSLIAVGNIIICKSLDKLVKTMDVKVSTKRWRVGSQTQRYGGSGTG